jgi:large repetitive protein
MDYQGTRDTASEAQTGDTALGRASSDLTGGAAASASAGAVALIPDANNTVVLPDGATLDDITVRGRDLVIQLDDGRTFIIPDGAVFVPQIVAQGVTVPPLNLAALLIGQEPEPAAGPVRSSGGNFAVPVDPLQDAYDLGDLLPYTELAFPKAPQNEIFPPVDRQPETGPNAAVLLDDDALQGGNAGGTGDDPDAANLTGTLAGSGGDGALTWALSTTGAPAGFSYVANGTGIDIYQGETLVVRVTLNAATGAYVVTQIAPIDHAAGSDENNQPFTLTYAVTDQDGDSAAGTLAINVDDDTPVARNDTDTVAAGTYGPETGNVLTGAGTTSGTAGADSMGADGGTLTGVRAGTTGNFAAPGGSIDGAYGTLTLNANGSYSYTRDPGTPGGVLDVFTYQITDGDGDITTATLTINIGDAEPLTAANAFVRLDDDALAGGNSGGTGDDADAANLTGTLSGSGGDGPIHWELATTSAPVGFSYVANGTGIDVFQGDTLVLRVTLNTATGAYTVTQVAPIQHAAGGDENNTVFTLNYIVSDQDGDEANGTLTINVDDDTPTVQVQVEPDVAALVVDESTLPATATSDLSGLFSHSFGADGAGSIAYGLGVVAGPSGLVDTLTGENVILSITGGVVEGRTATGGLLVFTISVDAGGTVSLTQNRAVTHDPNFGPNDVEVLLSRLVTLTQTVTDSDGDPVSATANIGGLLNFVDDAPSASNDTDTIASGSYGPTTGNVLTDASAGDSGDSDSGADTLGNDGGSVTAITGFTGPGTIGGITTGQYGVLTLNPDGSYSYTRNPGTPGGVTDTFTYTVTDGDGDTATATLTITIADALPLTAANADVLLDDDALAGGNPGGTGDDADAVNLTGTLSGSGGDGPLTWTLVSYSPTVGLTAALVNPGLVHVFQGTTLVMTIAVNNATGAYTVTQVAPIDHAALGDENNATFRLNYVVSDQDSDSAGGSILINLDDDTPVVANDTDLIASGSYGPATGNVLTDTSAGDLGDSDTGADSMGADGGSVTAITGFGGAGTIAGTTTGQYGVLTLNADGSYSYTRNPGTPGGVTDTFTYTVTDGDGDTATATLTITIEDALPLTAANATVLLDDDTLAGGNPGGTGDDADAANLTGTLAASGGDGPLTWALATTGAPSGFSYVANGTGIDVMQGTTLVMQVTLNAATGAYTVTQVAPIAHAAGLDENNTQFTFGYTVTDQDGDVASGTLGVDVDDDTPVLANDTDSIASGTYGPATGNVLTDASAGDSGDSDSGADSLGADGGTLTAITGFGGAGTVGGSTTGQYGVLTLNADGSYSYTRNPGTPGGVTDTFTYTVTDGDGDTATATLTITIADALPVTAANADVQLDDDALAGGNPGGIGDDPDAVNLTGTLSGSGGDGPLTWTLVSYNPTVGLTASLVNPGLVHVFQGTTLVMTIAVNNATGAYTVTQVAPIDHAALGDENNATFRLNYVVSDQDSDSAGGSILINLDDDTPVLANDTDAILSGSTTPATGNVLTDASAGDVGDSDTGADSMGADSGTLTAITGFGGPGTLGGTTQGQYGVLTLNADGSYSYTRNAGTPGDVVDVFTYTVTDGDGDTATATLTITIEDAAPFTTPNATVLLDDDALAGGNPGGTGDDPDSANTTGTLSGSGGDGALTWALLTTGAPAGFTYTANGTGINVMQGSTLVMQVTLNTATGAYTVTQVAPIDHAAGDNENNTAFTFNYTVTDQDGDSAPGTLSVDVDDDTPIALAASLSGAVDEEGLAGGNVGGIGDLPGTATSATGSVASLFAAGADGPVTYSLSTVTSGLPALASGGVALTYAVAGNTLTASAGASTVFTFTLNPTTGAWTFTLVRPIDHSDPASEDDIAINFGGLIIATDGDGDSVTAIGGLTVTIDDDRPFNNVANPTVRLDDDALTGGNPGGTGDDVNAANTTGTLNGTFGADGAGSFVFLTTGAPAGFSYVASGSGINVMQGTTLVMTITLNPTTGAYTVSQNAPIQHAAGSDENNLTFSLSYNILDRDGDVFSGAVLAINVDDDTPVLANDTDSIAAGTYGPATGNVLTDASAGDLGDSDTGADSMGADGGTLTAITGAGGAGTIGGSTTGQYGVLTLNADGSYSYTRNPGTPGGVSDTFTYTITDGDGDTATATLIITIADALPVTAANATVLLDDDTRSGGNAGGTGDDTDAANLTGTLAASGGDGPLTWALSTAGAPAGFTYTANGTGIDVLQGTTLVMQVTLNAATGAYTVAQVAPIDHAAGLDENNTQFTFGYTVTDQDGDTANGSLAVDVDDDTPVLANDTDSLLAGATGPATGNVLTDASAGDAGDSDSGADSLGADGGTVTAITGFGGAGTIGGTTTGQHGTLTLSADGSYSYVRSGTGPISATDMFTYTVTDGDGDTATATLTITLADAGPSTSANAAVLLDDDALAGGNPGGSGDDVNAANTTGTLAASGGDGALTWALLATGAPAGFSYVANGTGIDVFQGTTKVLAITLNPANGGYTVTQVAPIVHTNAAAENNQAFTLNYTVTDQDGDSAGGTLAIDVDDDTPTASASSTQPTLIVDETLLGSDATESFASVFTTAFGADGPATANSLVYALGINAGGTGLVDVATGATVVLTVEAGQVVGRAGAGGPIVFTVSVAANGNVTLDQQRAVQHNDPLDHDEPGDSAAMLALDTLITLTATATDRDGDTVSATANIGRNLQFEDDGPTITSVTTPLAIANSGSVSGTGNFVFSTGNDGAAGVNDAIQSVTFAGTVNGVAVTSPTIVAGTENATTANYTFSFTYSTGAATTATATGTLVFDKVAGTYTVDLDAPIQAFSVNGTAAGTAFLGYELNSAISDGSQPAVAVTQVSNNLFLQFTSVAEPSSGTGANNLNTVNYGLDVTPPSDGAPLSFSNGELFNQAAGWVSISNTANGVNGDTIASGEVLDFNLYSGNPQGFVGGVPTASTQSMYLKFDGIGTGEDFIMILKLWNPTTGEYTTRAIMVQNTDIQKGPGSGPGVFSGITLDNNDGLIVIEANDYNLAGENFVIVGAQVAGSDEGIAGLAFNFNNATGAGGGSTAAPLQAFSTDTGDGPMKISDIGFVVQTSTAQPAQLTFGVTVQDRDGDTATQTLTVNIGAAPVLAQPLSAKAGTTTTTTVSEPDSGAITKLTSQTSGQTTVNAAASGLLAAMTIDQFMADAGDALGRIGSSFELGTQSALFDRVSTLAEANPAGLVALDHSLAALAPELTQRFGGIDDPAGLRGALDQMIDRFADQRFELGGDAGKSGLFDFGDHGMTAMDTLLAPNAFAATGGLAESGHPAIAGALADSAGTQAIDSIVDHFAGGATGVPEQLGQGASFGFESLLQLNVNGGGSDLASPRFGMMQMIDHEEANTMA